MCKFEYWDDIAAGFLLLLALTAVVLITTATVASHKVSDYYVVKAGSDAAICVYADLPWATDASVFCTNDPEQAIRIAKEANDLLPKSK